MAVPGEELVLEREVQDGRGDGETTSLRDRGMSAGQAQTHTRDQLG